MTAPRASHPSSPRDHASGTAGPASVPSRAGLLRRSLLALLVGMSIGGAAQAQTATNPNEGSRLTYDGLLGTYTFSWWGQPGRTYFLQRSADLATWEYLPLIKSGSDAALDWSFPANAAAGFLRLRSSDLPTTDPFTADFDGDKVSNWDELLHSTDPLTAADTDANGLPDDWETFYFGHLGVDPSALAPGGDGLTNQQHFALGSDPNTPPPLSAPPPPTITVGTAVFDQPATTSVYPAPGNLVTNGDFSKLSLGTLKWKTYSLDLAKPNIPSIPGWKPLFGTLVELQNIAPNTAANAGQYCELDAHWQPSNPSHSGDSDHGLQQTLNLARGHYFLSFDYRARKTGADSFTVKLQTPGPAAGSTVETEILTKSAAANTWKRAFINFQVTGGDPAATAFPIKLLFDEVGARDSYGSHIDNVVLLPVEVKFTRNKGEIQMIGDVGEFGQKSGFATGSFSVIDKMRAISVLRISSDPGEYNCNTVIGNLGTAGGLFKVEITNMPPGNYSVNITVYASASSSNGFSGSMILIYGPDQNAVMSGFGRMSAPYLQEKTIDIPVTVNSSGVGLVVISEPVATASEGGTSTQSVSVKVNGVTRK